MYNSGNRYSSGYHRGGSNFGKSTYKNSKPKDRSFQTSGVSYPRADHVLPIINTPQYPYLSWLVEGVKRAEGRVNGPACQKMRIGDTILLCDRRRGQYVFGTIAFKNEYRSFEKMLISEGVSNMLPFLNDDQLNEGLRTYNGFPGSERVNELGCVAIGIDIKNFNI